VSHHIHCNDDALDEDVFSAFPLLRFDPRLPKMWFHQFQHIYMWFTFPFLQVGFQFTDLLSLAVGRTAGASLYGATNVEKATTLLGKIAHFSLLWAIPLSIHGASDVIPAAIAYMFTQGVVLASTFAVSHNVPETKPLYEGGEAIAAAVRTLHPCSCFQKHLSFG
jgi:acyl-lipid (7-3)-desaturase (Delta-4 desaturase)